MFYSLLVYYFYYYYYYYYFFLLFILGGGGFNEESLLPGFFTSFLSLTFQEGLTHACGHTSPSQESYKLRYVKIFLAIIFRALLRFERTVKISLILEDLSRNLVFFRTKMKPYFDTGLFHYLLPSKLYVETGAGETKVQFGAGSLLTVLSEVNGTAVRGGG